MVLKTCEVLFFLAIIVLPYSSEAEADLSAEGRREAAELCCEDRGQLLRGLDEVVVAIARASHSLEEILVEVGADTHRRRAEALVAFAAHVFADPLCAHLAAVCLTVREENHPRELTLREARAHRCRGCRPACVQRRATLCREGLDRLMQRPLLGSARADGERLHRLGEGNEAQSIARFKQLDGVVRGLLCVDELLSLHRPGAIERERHV